MQGKEKLIYAALLGAALGDALPTIADAVYFKQQQKLNQQLANGEITAEQKWKRDAAYYYTTNSIYWLLVAGIVYNIKGDYHKKMKAVLWIMGGSAVIGIIAKNIQKDTKFYKEHKLVKVD